MLQSEGIETCLSSALFFPLASSKPNHAVNCVGVSQHYLIQCSSPKGLQAIANVVQIILK